jgi:hypothetical protein
MPRLSVWFVRAALIYLLAGFTLGALMLAEKGIPYDPGVWAVFPIHVEFLLVGWLVQFALGVAFWILPRFGRGAPRGKEGFIWAAFLLLNAGVLLVAVQLWMPAAVLLGRLCEMAALGIYIAASWRRVKPMMVEPAR